MLHRVATKEREEIKRTTKQKMARQQRRREPPGLGKQQTGTMEDIDGGLHPAADGQSLDEDELCDYIHSFFFRTMMDL